MQRREKLLLSFMVGCLVLFCETTVVAALTPQTIYKIAEDSTVHLGFTDAKGNRWTGSGFVVRNGHIATNHHVVDNMWIGFAKLVGKEEGYPIETILDSDKERDLAIIKVAGIDAPALPLGDSDTVQIGDAVYVAGNPQGLESSFSEGIISAIRGGSTDKLFQMTAPISQGSSGGPVFNEAGEVIGVSFATLHDGQNLNFAIPVNYLKSLANISFTPTPIRPKPVKPKLDPPPIEPKPVKPTVNPPPVEPQPAKPQVNSTKLGSSKSQPRRAMLDKGIKLYEQAKYSEASEVLSSVIQELEDSEQQAEAYLYLGCSKWGIGEGNNKVRAHFENSIRHNPDQKLPPRIGEDHPIFGGLLEEVHRKLTGELTVISLLPQTEIWIEGNNIDRKMLGIGIVKRRLLKGYYVVEGIYAGGSKKRTVTIEPNRHKEIDLEIPPIIKHDSPLTAPVGEIIPLTLNLISSQAPQRVTIHYKTYDRDGDPSEQNSQKMRLWDKQPTSSTWIYKVGLISQKHVNSIEYYIEIEYESHLTFRQPETPDQNYQVAIIEDQPPTINLLDPPEGAQFTVNQQITFRAEVTDDNSVKEVRVHFSPANSQKLTEEDGSGIYTIDITVSEAGFLQYYLTATDEAGNKSESESRQIEIKVATDNRRNERKVEPEPVEIKPEEAPEKVEPGDPPPTIPADSSEGPPLMSSAYPMYQGGWVSAGSNSLDWEVDKMFRLAYLREGKNHPTLGAQLEFSHPGSTNVSAIMQWGPIADKNRPAFTILGGVAKYETYTPTDEADTPIGEADPPTGQTYTRPLLGAGLKFYPRDKIAIEATGSIKFPSDADTTSIYHYEIGARVYISPRLNLRVGYGKLYLGNRDIATMHVGLGFIF